MTCEQVRSRLSWLLDGELEALKAMKGRFAGEGKACLFCGRSGEG